MTAPSDRTDSDGEPVASAGMQVDVAALYNSHHRTMHAAAMRVLAPNGLSGQASDAVQVVVHALQEMHRRGRLTERKDWAPYLRKATRNAALEIIKDHKPDRVQSLDVLREEGQDFSDRTEGHDPVGDEAILARQAQQLHDAIDQVGLNPREREILVGYFFHDRSDAELADDLGISRERVGFIRRSVQNQLGRHMEGR